MEFRNIKVRTPDRETCIAVQKFLFENGCSWHGGQKEPQNPHAKFLYVSDKGEILWGSGITFFESAASSGEYKEVVFETKQVLAIKSMKYKERPKVTVLGTEYFVDELEARLAGLEAAR